MERLTFKTHDGGMFVKESDVKTYEVEDEIMHTGNAIRKLSEYEDLEEQKNVSSGYSKWIACGDRLPDKSGSYLVTTYSNGISQHISDIDQFVYNGMPNGYWLNAKDVIAWQSLPEPYRP